MPFLTLDNPVKLKIRKQKPWNRHTGKLAVQWKPINRKTWKHLETDFNRYNTNACLFTFLWHCYNNSHFPPIEQWFDYIRKFWSWQCLWSPFLSNHILQFTPHQSGCSFNKQSGPLISLPTRIRLSVFSNSQSYCSWASLTTFRLWLKFSSLTCQMMLIIIFQNKCDGLIFRQTQIHKVTCSHSRSCKLMVTRLIKCARYTPALPCQL